MTFQLGRSILPGIVVAALALSTAAAEPAKRGKEMPRAPEAAAAAALPAAAADAPNARLAGLIRRDGKILRNKNIKSVSRPAIGVFCITPASAISPSSAIVMLTPEYYYSLYAEIKVQWAVGGNPCSSKQIAVYTLADVNLDARYEFSNAVSFSIVVP